MNSIEDESTIRITVRIIICLEYLIKQWRMHCIIPSRNGTKAPCISSFILYARCSWLNERWGGVIKIFFHYVPQARARDRRKAQLAVTTWSADAEGEACSEWSLVCTIARGKSRSVHDHKKKRKEEGTDDKELLDCHWPSENKPFTKMELRILSSTMGYQRYLFFSTIFARYFATLINFCDI